MEIVITYGFDTKSIYGLFREVLNMMGIALQPNILFMSGDFPYPVDVGERHEIVFLISEKYRTRIREYIGTELKNKQENNINSKLFLVCDDEETVQDLISLYGSSFKYYIVPSNDVYGFVNDDEFYQKMFHTFEEGEEKQYLEKLSKKFIKPIQTYIKDNDSKELSDIIFKVKNQYDENPYFIYMDFKVQFDQIERDANKLELDNNRRVMRYTSLINNINEANKREQKKTSGDRCSKFCFLLGNIFENVNCVADYEAASDYYKEAFAINNKNANYAYFVASSLQKRKRIGDREMIFYYYEKAIELNKIGYRSWYKMGCLCNWLMEREWEIRHFIKVIDCLRSSYDNGYLTYEELDYLWKSYTYLRDAYESMNNFKLAKSCNATLMYFKKKLIPISTTDLAKEINEMPDSLLHAKEALYRVRI